MRTQCENKSTWTGKHPEAMLKYPSILLLSSDEPETGILQETLKQHVDLTRARNLIELQRLLETGDYDCLFCNWFFHTGTWNQALEEVRKRDPELPVIILSRVAGEKEWIEVLQAGAFDLLVPPYREQLVLAVVEHAVASREARILRKLEPVLGKM